MIGVRYDLQEDDVQGILRSSAKHVGMKIEMTEIDSRDENDGVCAGDGATD